MKPIFHGRIFKRNIEKESKRERVRSNEREKEIDRDRAINRKGDRGRERD